MDKIYRRSTQLGDTPKKKKDEKARYRAHYYNFHVTENEKKLIENRISMFDMKKNIYFRQSLLYQNLLVKWNPRSAEEIKRRMDEIEGAIKAGHSLTDMDPLMVDSIRSILELLDKIYGKKER